MSSEALAWAFKQECKSASVKFTLVALCECANYKTGRIMPSIEHLTEITGQNRKTIIANVAELEAAGFIRDTGERVGRTMQIKVYEAALQTVPKAEQSQKRNSSENGRKQSQKRDTEPSLEPSCSTEPNGSSEHSARTKPHRMLESWQPGPLPPTVSALTNLWPDGRLAREVEQFRDYWLDRTEKRPGWDRTFHNRIRDIHDRVLRESSHGRQQHNNVRPIGGDQRSKLARAIDEGLDWLGNGPQAQVS